ncbi:hypothetical protein SEMRO_1537_G280720.1 [Seminavis robusta]|uniref:Uncharacterized protein n=1 Tax=Seminavis robusta TaxID=568900 RepID=A0A9N8HTP4_9STRA|nr:hypothetical protein SEMRO_1537_G280720.1 [Seminavis robusta]|eukprot:Sro1537_g280720.1 n/a (472) ;mRNA; r:23860-25275
MTDNTTPTHVRLADSPYLQDELADVPQESVNGGPSERYHKSNGDKAIDLMAMGIGLKTGDGREVGNTDVEPYASMKFRKKVVATQRNLVEEIKRRCKVDALKQPTCTYWNRKKCVEWLQKNPVSHTGDRAYILMEEKKLYDLLVKAANEKEDKKEKASPWNHPEPYIRLIECMLDETNREKFLAMYNVAERDELDARNSEDRPETIYEAAARLYNDESHLVLSRCLPDLHSTFSDVLECSLNNDHVPSPITPEDVQRRWGDCRAKLIKIIAKWELSGNGFGQRHEGDDEFGHLGEDELQCGDNRANFLDSQTKEHILYLWHIADQEEVLKHVMAVIAESSSATSTSCASVAGSDASASARKRRKEDRELAFFRAKMGLAMTSMSRAALFKELRELQDKEMDYQIKLLEASSSKMIDIYSKRVKVLAGQIDICQETIDEMDKEPPKKKKKSNKKKSIYIDSDDDSDDGDEED